MRFKILRYVVKNGVHVFKQRVDLHSIAAKMALAKDSLNFTTYAAGKKRSRYVEQAVVSPASISAMTCRVWYLLVKLKKGTKYDKLFK